MRIAEFFTRAALVAGGGVVFLAASSATAQACDKPNVLTNRYNNGRTGANTDETCLSPSTVTSSGSGEPMWTNTFPTPCYSGFAACYESASNSAVFAQPLFLSNVSIGGNPEDVLIVATTDDYVFAYNAENPSISYWTGSMSGQPGVSLIGDLGDCGGYGGGSQGPITGPGTGLAVAGVLSTPVVDVANKVVYVVGGCMDVHGNNHWILHGLHLTSQTTPTAWQAGTDIAGSPVDIGAGVEGPYIYVQSAEGAAGATQPGGSGGPWAIEFDPTYQLQRPGLLLDNGWVYVAFGVASYNETAWSDDAPQFTKNPYHGWVIGYQVTEVSGTPSISSAQPGFAFATTPTAPASGCTDWLCPDCLPGDNIDEDQNNCGVGGGVWMSGGAPAVYSCPAETCGSATDYMIVAAGNGGTVPGASFGSSVIAFVVGSTCDTTSAVTSSCVPPSSDSATPYFTPYCHPGNVSPAGCDYINNADLEPCGSQPCGSTVPIAQYLTMNAGDEDMGTSGVMVTNDTNYIVTCDKAGTCYVLNPWPGANGGAGLGGLSTTGDLAVNEFYGNATSPLCGVVGGVCDYTDYGWGSNPDTDNFQLCTGGGSDTYCHQISSQAYWNGRFFVWPRREDSDMCGFLLFNFLCSPRTKAKADDMLSPAGYPGGTVAVSANGTSDASTVVLWGIVFPNGKPNEYCLDSGDDFDGYLRAYQLETVSREYPTGLDGLWTSSDTWRGTQFSVPTVVNGSVYVSTCDKGVIEYQN